MAEVESNATGLTGVRLAGGDRVDLDALVVAPRFTARAELLAPLGLEPVEFRFGDHLVGTRIEADPTGLTAVPGVWVAGNVTELQAQVMGAAAAGLMAGAAINADLVAEDGRRAVADHRLGAAAQRGGVGGALPVPRPHLERQPQPHPGDGGGAAHPRVRPGRRVRRGGRCDLAGGQRLDRHRRSTCPARRWPGRPSTGASAALTSPGGTWT